MGYSQEAIWESTARAGAKRQRTGTGQNALVVPAVATAVPAPAPALPFSPAPDFAAVSAATTASTASAARPACGVRAETIVQRPARSWHGYVDRKDDEDSVSWTSPAA